MLYFELSPNCLRNESEITPWRKTKHFKSARTTISSQGVLPTGVGTTPVPEPPPPGATLRRPLPALSLENTVSPTVLQFSREMESAGKCTAPFAGSAGTLKRVFTECIDTQGISATDAKAEPAVRNDSKQNRLNTLLKILSFKLLNTCF